MNAPAEVLWVGRNIRWLGTKDAGWRPPLQKISSMLLNIYRKRKGGGAWQLSSVLPLPHPVYTAPELWNQRTFGWLMPSCLQRGASEDQDPRRWGNRETMPNATRHHHNDSCIKMGSDESHFNVSLIVRGKVTKIASPDHNFWTEESQSRIEPRSLCLPA